MLYIYIYVLDWWIRLSLISASGRQGKALIYLLVNESPTMGSCTLTPPLSTDATEMETEFKIYCHDWKDEVRTGAVLPYWCVPLLASHWKSLCHLLPHCEFPSPFCPFITFETVLLQRQIKMWLLTLGLGGVGRVFFTAFKAVYLTSDISTIYSRAS